MALFFDLLPTDLHIWVLQFWIGGNDDAGEGNALLLQALSALDIACCNLTYRPDFLHLTSCIVPSSIRGVKHIAQLLQWAGSRSIAMKTVVLNMTSFHSRYLPRFGFEKSDSQLVFASRVCNTNLKLPELKKVAKLLGLLEWDGMHEVLAKADAADCPADQYWALAIEDIGMDSGNAFLSCMTMHCNALRVLHYKGYYSTSKPLLQLVTQACPQLQVLMIDHYRTNLVDVISLMLSCKEIRCIVLKDDMTDFVVQSADDITAIMEIGQQNQLREFAIPSNRIDRSTEALQITTFAKLLASNPWLECLALPGCSLRRSSHHLTLKTNSRADIINIALPNVLEGCCDVQRLTVCGLVAERSLATLGQRIGAHLLQLTYMQGDRSLVALLSQCHELIYLQFGCEGDRASTAVLYCASKSCKRLQHLDIYGFGWERASEVSLVSAISALPELKVIKVSRGAHLTLKTFKAIVSNKLQLEKFYWGEGIKKEVVDEFYLLAKSAGLLPVPRILRYEDQ